MFDASGDVQKYPKFRASGLEIHVDVQDWNGDLGLTASLQSPGLGAHICSLEYFMEFCAIS